MISKYLFIVIIGTIFCTSTAETVNGKSEGGELKTSFKRNCESYSLTCLKLDAVSWFDKLSENDDISVLPGVSLVRENNSAKANTGDIVAELAREFPNDSNARLDAFLMKKLTGFLENRSIKLNFWNNDQPDSVGSARKKGKKGDGGMGMMLAAGAMMKGMMMSLAMGGLAAMAGKALMTGLISLMLSAIIGIKSLSSGSGHSTYEVVAKPVHSHSSSGQGWDRGYETHARSLENAPLPMSLQPGYQPPQ